MSHTQTLKNTEGLTFEELEEKVRLGARFIVYQYTISLIAVTLRRLTPAYYIPPDISDTAFKKNADILSVLFGWWGIPWGPLFTIQSLAANRKGGIDITKDVMLNLTKNDFQNNRVVVAALYSPYHTPNKTETECLRKSLGIFMQQHPDIGETWFALYVNAAEPFFMIGLPGKYTQQPYTDELKKILYKSFSRQARFEFLNMDEDNDLARKLKEMGLRQM